MGASAPEALAMQPVRFEYTPRSLVRAQAQIHRHLLVFVVVVILVHLLALLLLDHLLTRPDWPRIAKALVDTSGHAGSAGAAWLTGKALDLIRHGRVIRALLQAIICAILASLMDLDHFFHASRWSLTAATSLSTRPWLHSLPVAIAAALLLSYVAHRCNVAGAHRDTFLLPLTAVLTHQLRDAHRRGLWLYPLAGGASIPISYTFYLTFNVAIWPAVLAQLSRWSPG
ncbi:uncharacterized protein MONBRDRAFT_30124 [Monosiga brevicollis MX1]|uniref:Transmembrane protein 267 n=1 Tax=Monosiga brevicollis TaxID=81824 RepID=A9VD36_MONBE|nr:uncharacterized protein MONBRDRAFT_30124 [Monosiga brevicollis MX1]EDQ84612.1 predicted protein [Monosiga brevicollis MX1]|eukprot:XP_001750639.1 hypothetical protein [Monosiga brevicollis MX1]